MSINSSYAIDAVTCYVIHHEKRIHAHSMVLWLISCSVIFLCSCFLLIFLWIYRIFLLCFWFFVWRLCLPTLFTPHSSSALLPTLWVCALTNGYCPLLVSFHLGCFIVLLSMCGFLEEIEIYQFLRPVMMDFKISNISTTLYAGLF